MENPKGLIDSCRESGCGWKCCSFGQGGHIVILPQELDSVENASHLEVIDPDYFGGKKVRCNASDCKVCDNGYKPIMCRSYPLWPKSVSKEIVFKSGKCPLGLVNLQQHKKYVLNLFKEYDSHTPIDDFLSKAWVDRYQPLDSVSTNYDIRILSMKDHWRIAKLEYLQTKPSLCMKSSTEDIIKSLQSECSCGLWIAGELVAYSLAYHTDYGTAYIDKCYVSEAYRGQKFQTMLLRQNIDSLLRQGVHEIYAMTSPDNVASLKNFMSVGFEIAREVRFGDYKRYILRWQL